MNPTQPGIAPPQTDASQVQTGMYPQSQMDRTQFSTPTQMPVSKEVISSDYDSTISPYTGDLPRFAGGGLDQYQYAKGGEVGIKSAAKELAQYGRMGDTIVAHINPQEAHMLKQMGGSGTINPHTGLPEYFSLGNVLSGVTDSISHALGTAGGGGGLLGGLASLDKMVGKAIPGGWGTLAAVAGSAMGLPTAAMVGLGALNGSGVTHKGGSFNLQGALMGGAMAYGMSNLGDAIRAADVAPPGSPSVDIPSTPDVTPNTSVGLNPSPAPGGGLNVTNPTPTGFNTSSLSSGVNPTPSVLPPEASGIGSTLSNVVDKGISNLQSTGQGITNLSGMGPSGVSASDALAAAKGSGATIQNTALPIAGGIMSASAADAARQYQSQADAQNSAANAQYNAQMAAIQDSQDRANRNMRAHPYQFAGGGAIAFGNGGDVPRFLSGGGDGLSDSIDATIDNNQPAKLADGEFVVSSDVVSGLGGGSSKAGAKKLYAMMDRVRKQAHGTKKQIRPVSTKALPA